MIKTIPDSYIMEFIGGPLCGEYRLITRPSQSGIRNFVYVRGAGVIPYWIPGAITYELCDFGGLWTPPKYAFFGYSKP